ncbi:hypothetical protein PCNPT3_07605 [Psychromonas sp. CNPT3]|nr:hypothetical protein PCNPT3_07605 [Psychromonas sp. CNPT3]
MIALTKQVLRHNPHQLYTLVVINLGEVKYYPGHNIDIFVSYIFTLSAKKSNPVDAIYDRVAFVA